MGIAEWISVFLILSYMYSESYLSTHPTNANQDAMFQVSECCSANRSNLLNQWM